MEKKFLVPEGCPTVTPQKASPPYQHAGDFSVMTIGTGCPETVLGRSFPSTLMQYKGHYFLVDVGEGTTARLAQVGISGAKIHHVLFTHHHADHDGGYPLFLVDSWITRRGKLTVVGPPKTRALHELAINYYCADLQYRAICEGRPLAEIEAADIVEFEDKGALELGGVKITTAKLTHTAHNLGYRFEADGKVIVVSGDTSYDPALVALAKDADILVMDAGAIVGTGYIGASRPKAVGDTAMRPRPRPHLSACTVMPHPLKGDVGRMAAEAGVKGLIITHYGPEDVDEEGTTAMYRNAGYTGEVAFGRDLTEFVP